MENRSDLFSGIYGLDCILEQTNTIRGSSVAVALQVNDTRLSLPNGSAVCRDNLFAALEGFGDNESKVLAQSRKNEHIAPGPIFL